MMSANMWGKKSLEFQRLWGYQAESIISHVDKVFLVQNYLNHDSYNAIATWPQLRLMFQNVYFNCNAATRSYMEA